MADLQELAVALKAYRRAAGESVEELADATEIAPSELKKMEAGLHAPSEMTLEVIARHFSLREHEAKRLLELAGHSSDEFSMQLDDDTEIDFEKLARDSEVLMTPVFYTDQVNVTSNNFGVTISFIQTGSTKDKPIVISRVGMSHKHAESVMKVIEESLKKSREKMGEDEKPE